METMDDYKDELEAYERIGQEKNGWPDIPQSVHNECDRCSL